MLAELCAVEIGLLLRRSREKLALDLIFSGSVLATGSLTLVIPSCYSSELLLSERSQSIGLQAQLFLGQTLVLLCLLPRELNIVIFLLTDLIKVFKFSCQPYKRQNSMETSAVIGIEKSYPIYIYILIPCLTIYTGAFVAVSNHYVLKPKIESFLEKASLSSNLVKELIIDLLSNLTFITFVCSAYLLMPPNDSPIRILTFHNTYWLTLCLGILLYCKISSDESASKIVLFKNGLFVFLCCVDILYHYFTKTYLISMPLVLTGLYLINLIINANEQKFIQIVLQVMGMQAPSEYRQIPKGENQMPEVFFLAEHYPITKRQLEEKLQSLEEKHNAQFNAKKNLLNKINTKVLVKEKLMEMSMCIYLSRLKMEQEEIVTAQNHFGYMNGTITEKKGQGQKKRKIGNASKVKNKDNMNKINELEPTQEAMAKINLNLAPLLEAIEKPVVSAINLSEGQSNNESIVFYIFPVKLFESSKIISSLVSVFINLGFGVLLSFCNSITATLQYGEYFEFIYAALLLPLLPNISAPQYFNTMILASLLKYGVMGLAIGVSAAISSPTGITISWAYSPFLEYHVVILMLVLCISEFTILKEQSNYKIFFGLFFIALAANSGLIYISVKFA